MRVTNKTDYSTLDLKKLFTRCMDEEEIEGGQRDALWIEVVYSRRSYTGYAYIKGTYTRLRIPREGLNPRRLAWLACHELAHIRGVRGHRKMGRQYGWKADMEAFAWADAFTVSKSEPRSAAPAKDLIAARAEHAMKMLERALTRLRRAETLAAKWRRKATYYQHVLHSRAAASPGLDK